MVLLEKRITETGNFSSRQTKAAACRLPSDGNTSTVQTEDVLAGAQAPHAMPTSPRLGGGRRRGRYNRLFCLVVVNVYNSSPFGLPEVCGALPPPGSQPVCGRVCALGMGTCVASPGHRRPLLLALRRLEARPRPGDAIAGRVPPLPRSRRDARVRIPPRPPHLPVSCSEATARTGPCSPSAWVTWFNPGSRSVCSLPLGVCLMRRLPATGWGCR